MKLIKAISKPVFNDNNIIFSSINSTTRRGASFEIENNVLRVRDYSFGALVGSVMYEGRWVFVYELQGAVDTEINKIRNGQYYFKTEYGDLIEFSEMLSACLIYNVTYNFELSPQFVFIISNFQKYEDEKAHSSLVAIDLKKNSHKSIPFEFDSFSNLEGTLIAVGSKNGSRVIAKYNLNLEEAWRFIVDGKSPNSVLGQRPINNGDSLIINLCVQRQRRGSVDGEIFCLTKSEGKEVWKRKFPLPVLDCQRLNTDQIIIYTENFLQVLCSKTGKTIQIIETRFEVAPASVYLFVYAKLLFALNKNQSLIRIYDTVSFECIREVDVSDHGWLLNQRLKIFNNKIYLTVNHRRIYSSLLIIDPQDILAPLEIEPDPDFVITPPAEHQSFVLIVIENISIDDLIRFGEATVLEQIRDHGKNFFNNTPNKYFDGHALLKIKGLICDDDKRAVSLLDMMVERVNFFADQDGFRCGSGKNMGYMTYELDG